MDGGSPREWGENGRWKRGLGLGLLRGRVGGWVLFLLFCFFILVDCRAQTDITFYVAVLILGLLFFRARTQTRNHTSHPAQNALSFLQISRTTPYPQAPPHSTTSPPIHHHNILHQPRTSSCAYMMQAQVGVFPPRTTPITMSAPPRSQSQRRRPRNTSWPVYLSACYYAHGAVGIRVDLRASELVNWSLGGGEKAIAC